MCPGLTRVEPGHDGRLGGTGSLPGVRRRSNLRVGSPDRTGRPPPPLEGGGWGEGSSGTDHRPLPPTPSLKGRGGVSFGRAVAAVSSRAGRPPAGGQLAMTGASTIPVTAECSGGHSGGRMPDTAPPPWKGLRTDRMPVFIGYDRAEQMVAALLDAVMAWRPDAVVGILRGGLVPATMASCMLALPLFCSAGRGVPAPPPGSGRRRGKSASCWWMTVAQPGRPCRRRAPCCWTRGSTAPH